MKVKLITGNPGRYHGNPSCCRHYWKEGKTNRSTELGEGESSSNGQHRKMICPLCHLLGRVWLADILFCHPEIDVILSLRDRTPDESQAEANKARAKEL